MARPIQFIREVRTELGKVIWPTRRQAIRMTLQVIFVSLLIALLLGLVDLGLSELLEKFVIR